ncbi:MAG: adenine phosphoribosyltransferase [Conexibacter sp.]
MSEAVQSPSEQIGQLIREQVRVVPDFPRDGILFQDLSPVYAQPRLVRRIADALLDAHQGHFDHVVAVEARGFVVGAAVAYAAESPLVLVRKPGKLPGPVHAASYQLEYGTDALELQHDALPAGSRALIVDDVLATGGTVAAVASLVNACEATVGGVAVLLEIPALAGRARLAPHRLTSLYVVEG